jgi:hypothetical protein
VLAEHKFSYTFGEKTNQVIESVLLDFSTSQIFNFIWRASQNAASYYLRENVTKQHAANTVVGSILRQAERAKTENWNIKGFERNYKCPQSLMSQVLYDVVLKIGDEGFKTVPFSIY